MKREYDFIIIGQGLAGSCLALELAKIGKSFIVINDAQGPSSSRVAGGLINPITGRKMVLTWRAHELFPFLHDFYTKAQEKFNTTFYFDTPIYRPFISIEEQNEWQGKSVDAAFSTYISKVKTEPEAEEVVNDPFGGILLQNSGYLDTNLFLDKVVDWLLGVDCLLNETFSLNSLNFIENAVVYKQIKANKIIFCNGVSDVAQAFFPKIKFRPVKGEVLTVKMDVDLNKVYNRGVFVMQRKGNQVVGSNYNHKDLTWTPTEEGKAEIEQKLSLLLKRKYVVVGHKAGVRPSVSDRRPVLGPSILQEQAVIFNGLGTKGVSLAPFFANHLVNWMVNSTPIDKEVNVNRFH